MIEELKPCPFCGNVPRVVDEGVERDMGFRYAIYCPACDTSVAQATADEFALAVVAWNTRPAEDALRIRVVELEERWIGVPWGSIVAAWHALDDSAMKDVLQDWLDADAPKEQPK